MSRLSNYEEILDTNPLMRLVIPMMVGIVFGDLFSPIFLGWHLLFFTLALCSICGSLLVYRLTGDLHKKRRPFYTLLSLTLFFLGAGALLGVEQKERVSWPDHAVDLRAMVVGSPKENKKVWQVDAEILGGEYADRKIRLGLLKDNDTLQTAEASEPCEMSCKTPRVGDVLLLHTHIQSPRNAGNPSEFDFAKWLKRQGFSGTAFCLDSQWKISSVAPDTYPISVQALRWRDALVKQYEQYFEGRELAVLSAMTLGDKTHLDANTRDVFSHTGVSHVLALSGLHLSILFMLFNRLVITRCHRRWTYLLTSLLGICGIWAFALMAGFPLSLLRAAVMFSVLQIMVCLRHDSLSLNNLALAALILLVISPQSLFDVGFQLSFASVLSILLLAVNIPCPQWISYSRCLRALYSVLVVSCCAQLGTAPLVAYYFHTFPVYNLIANCVAIPLTYGILAASILFFLLPFLQSILAIGLGIMLALLDVVLVELSELPGAVLELYPSLAGVFLGYGIIICFVGYVLYRQPFRLYFAALCLVLFSAVEFYTHRPDRLAPQLVFYHVGRLPILHAISSPETSYIWSNQLARADSSLKSVKQSFWKEEHIAPPKMLDRKYKNNELFYQRGILSFQGIRVGLCSEMAVPSTIETPFPIDYLYLTKGVTADLSEILKCYAPRTIVLDASLSDFYYKKYSQEVSRTSCEYYDIRRQGALIVKL